MIGDSPQIHHLMGIRDERDLRASGAVDVGAARKWEVSGVLVPIEIQGSPAKDVPDSARLVFGGNSRNLSPFGYIEFLKISSHSGFEGKCLQGLLFETETPRREIHLFE